LTIWKCIFAGSDAILEIKQQGARCGTHTGALFLVSHRDIPSRQALPAFLGIPGGKPEFISRLRFYLACFFFGFLWNKSFCLKESEEKE